jgi:hypothetical protein
MLRRSADNPDIRDITDDKDAAAGGSAGTERHSSFAVLLYFE